MKKKRIKGKVKDWSDTHVTVDFGGPCPSGMLMIEGQGKGKQPKVYIEQVAPRKRRAVSRSE